MVVQEEGAASELPVLAAITNTHQEPEREEEGGPGDPGTFWKVAATATDTHTL